MRTEGAWAGLVAGGIDARRVDPDGRHDYFWIVTGLDEPGLLFHLDEATEQVRPLPRMRHLDLSYRNVSGRPSLVLLLRDAEQLELFESLCRDIVDAGKQATDNREALERTLRRTLRWHHLLRGGRTDQLSPEEQRGLIGELHFLTRLVDLIGARAAIEAWKGPAGGAKDFELGDILAEVKSRRGAARPHVQISSEDQLADVEGCRLFLIIYQVDTVTGSIGSTLTELVQALEKRFAASDPVTWQLWDQAIAATGFDFEHDYSDRRWSVGNCSEYEVRLGFPRIEAPVPAGVSNVKYSIALDACAPFAIDAGVLDGLVNGGMFDGRA